MLSKLKDPRAVCLAAALSLLTASAFAQTSQAPYAAIDRNAVNYAGPGRDAAHDLRGSEIRIGLLASLSGPRRAEGEALTQAAQLALQDESANPLPDGRRLVLVARDESGPWGRAASEVVRLVVDDRAVAVITSPSGVAAHLAEQVGNKLGVPIITLSTDTTTTQINLPWIFRLGPTDLEQARLFARDIYTQRRLKRVVLVTERGHDSRVGAEEFAKAARELSPELPPTTVSVRAGTDGTLLAAPSAVQEILAQKPEVLVFWTGPSTASELVERIRASLPSLPIYLCRKAAQGNAVAPVYDRRQEYRRSQSGAAEEDLSPKPCRSCPDVVAPVYDRRPSSEEPSGRIWTVAAESSHGTAHANFAQRYRERTGSEPSVACAQAYDAVRLIAAALRKAGPNRARLRDALAEIRNFPGASGIIAFDHAGNDLSGISLVTVR